MIDYIAGNEVKCFKGELINYNISDLVPCELFKYNQNFMILSREFTDGLLDTSFSEFSIIVIQESKVSCVINIKEITNNVFNNVCEVRAADGQLLNITNREELYEFIYGCKKLIIKEQLLSLKYDLNEYYKEYERLCDNFREKWCR